MRTRQKKRHNTWYVFVNLSDILIIWLIRMKEDHISSTNEFFFVFISSLHLLSMNGLFFDFFIKVSYFWLFWNSFLLSPDIGVFIKMIVLFACFKIYLPVVSFPKFPLVFFSSSINLYFIEKIKTKLLNFSLLSARQGTRGVKALQKFKLQIRKHMTYIHVSDTH